MLRQLNHAILTLFVLAAFPGRAAAQTTSVGQRLEHLDLRDYRGKQHSLTDYASNDLIVLAFLGTECPLAKLYGPQLQKLSGSYPGVQFLGINSNRQDSITEIAASARSQNILFPILKDIGNRVADKLGAVRTPEVFVLDQDRKVRYRGRIDDRYGIGYIRDDATRYDLKVALDELLAGEEVSKPYVEPVGCHIGRVIEPQEDCAVTYSNQISRIMQANCVECHRKGEIAPFELRKYDEVVGWAETIAEVVQENRMPPWHADPKHGSFANERRLTSEEKQQVLEWVDNGAPEGDPEMLPAPRQFPVVGWRLPREPDAVFHMQEEPYDVPAEGIVDYKYFTVQTGFTEDKWVNGIELLPGNPPVVHHFLVLIRTPGNSQANLRSGFLGAYVPGLRADPYPKGMAKRIPAGSTLFFQLHYTPIGVPQTDNSKIGFLFAEPEEVTHILVTHQTANNGFRIPPNEANHKVQATSRSYKEEVELVAFAPHMHMRGKSFTYDALHPDGRRETLLHVPAYDFNWQTTYKLEQAISLPAGTRLHCVAHFDNSRGNLANPDPTIPIVWGDQIWDEMMIGYYDIAVPVEKIKAVFGAFR